MSVSSSVPIAFPQAREPSKKYDHVWSYLPTDVASILDIGGGSGHLATSMAHNGRTSRYHLVERAASCIAEAEVRGLTCTQHDIDRSALPFASSSFDLAYVSDVLEHVRNPWAVLAEATRVAKKYVFVYGPNFASLGCRLDALRGRPIRQMMLDRHGRVAAQDGSHVSHITYITHNNILFWAKRLGLTLVKERVFWYRRYALVRPLLERFFKNIGPVYEMVFRKTVEPVTKGDPNFEFYVDGV